MYSKFSTSKCTGKLCVSWLLANECQHNIQRRVAKNESFPKFFAEFFPDWQKVRTFRTQKSDYSNLCENFSKTTFQNDCAVTNEVGSDFDTCGFEVRKI